LVGRRCRGKTFEGDMEVCPAEKVEKKWKKLKNVLKSTVTAKVKKRRSCRQLGKAFTRKVEFRTPKN